MSKLLDQAIERVRTLSEHEQDDVAELLLNVLAKRTEPVSLDAETRASVRKGLAQADRGEFATDEEMAELFARYGA